MEAFIVVPDIGAEPMRLSAWFADVGDEVIEGDRLLEVAVGGATFDIAAPASGRLVGKDCWPDDALVPGQVLGAVHVKVDESADT